jgi:polar amino acid transport system substrate-binding protein
MPRLACLLAGLLLCAATHAQELKVVFNLDKPPFAFRGPDGAATGIEVDVMGQALARAGYTMKAEGISKVRLLSAVRKREADASAGVKGSDDGSLFFSDDISEYSNVAISFKSRQLRIDKLDDLDRHNFVIWQMGWSDLGPSMQAKYHPDAKGAFPANFHQSSTQDAQVRVFLNRRVDVIVIDRSIFAWLLRQMPQPDDELVYHDIFPGTNRHNAAFANKAVRDKFNAALRAIREDGSYEQIIRKYR